MVEEDAFGRRSSPRHEDRAPEDRRQPDVRSQPAIYRKKVAVFADAIMADDTRAEAFELIRSLVEEVRLVPTEGKLVAERRGSLAGILQLCSESKTRLEFLLPAL